MLVTRPQPQADAWAADLRAHELDAVALPLMAIVPPRRPAAVADTWRDLARYRLLVFVSPAAVAGFFQLRPPATTWPPATLAAAPGPGTASALRAAGVPAGQIVQPDAEAGQFDSEALWPALQARLPAGGWPGGHALIVAGSVAAGEIPGVPAADDSAEQTEPPAGRTWLAQRIAAAGGQVHKLAAYRRQAANWSDHERALAAAALARPQEHCWLLSSSEAIDHLQQALTGLLINGSPGGLPPGARALATHPRIAASAQAAGFAEVRSCRPVLADVAQALTDWDVAPLSPCG